MDKALWLTFWGHPVYDEPINALSVQKGKNNDKR